MEKVTKSFKNGIDLELVAGYEPMRQWYPTAEPETGDWIVDHVLPNWTVFDIGAHIGVYTMLLSKQAYEGEVYAFEPCEYTRKMLAENLVYNQGQNPKIFSNVHIERLAVGARSGQKIPAKLWFTDGTLDYGEITGEFDFISLDDFCLINPGITHLNFIKCDVDGWDYDVLVGAKNVLKKFRPFIIVEVNYALKWRGHDQNDVDRLLTSLQYRHRIIDPSPGNWLCWPEEKEI